MRPAGEDAAGVGATGTPRDQRGGEAGVQLLAGRGREAVCAAWRPAGRAIQPRAGAAGGQEAGAEKDALLGLMAGQGGSLDGTALSSQALRLW